MGLLTTSRDAHPHGAVARDAPLEVDRLAAPIEDLAVLDPHTVAVALADGDRSSRALANEPLPRGPLLRSLALVECLTSERSEVAKSCCRTAPRS
jgi:hypothetical protein